MDNENTIRKVLKHEITWAIMLIGAVWTIVSTIILPINTIQNQLAQLQTDIKQTKKDYNTAMEEHIALKSRLDILETEFKLRK